MASIPLLPGADADCVEALTRGAAVVAGVRIQAQPVAWWPRQQVAATRAVRRVLLRWLDDGQTPPVLEGPLELSERPSEDAGWSFRYTWVEGNHGEIPWRTALRHVPLGDTAYEMYQLDLLHGDRRVGLRLGLRWRERLYWWQYIRADFLQRGPVSDVLRVGGPIYNEESTVQSDLYLVLHANGLITAVAHFVNHQREGVGTDAHGVPVLAFDVPGVGAVKHVLTGARSRFPLGDCQLDMGTSAGFADAERPGSLRTEAGPVIWQPWLDQQVWGELLVEKEGVPEHRLVAGIGEGQQLTVAQRAAADRYWVAALGDQLLPRGVARSVPFALGLHGVQPALARYRPPAWWLAAAGDLPLGGRLPTSWWAVPHALQIAAERYRQPHPRGGPFELGRSTHDSDGTLGAALLLLGGACERDELCAAAALPAYWWADLAIDHVDFTCHELPKYSWQWIVQPYQRWLELVHAYQDGGDPYLLETARFAADAYCRFFWTNRPHRFVGRDALGVADLLALWQATGEEVYLDRAREILAEVRRSYAQPEAYSPGHQSGCGPNGVARAEDHDYIPMVLARLHVQLLQASEYLPPEEQEAAWSFVRSIAELVECKGGAAGWVQRGTSLSYVVLTALADRFPEEAKRWIALLRQRNDSVQMPDSHDGGKAFCWSLSSLWLDAWAWGATWKDGALHLRPASFLDQDRAPGRAVVKTPAGEVTLAREDGQVRVVGGARVRVE